VCPLSTREWQRSKPLLFSTRSFTHPYFDSCGIFTHVVISILATIAKQARIRLSERVQVGLARARSRGKLWYARIPSGSHLTEMLALTCSAYVTWKTREARSAGRKYPSA
jgi:DNA invertase Pin-like site-specific DNA recombinase